MKKVPELKLGLNLTHLLEVGLYCDRTFVVGNHQQPRGLLRPIDFLLKLGLKEEQPRLKEQASRPILVRGLQLDLIEFFSTPYVKVTVAQLIE